MLLVLTRVRIERQDRGDPLGAATLERVDHDQLFHQPRVQRPWMRLQDERVAAADRLIEADEDLAVGEIARGLRGDRDVELLGYLLSQFGVRAAREEHQILAVVGPLGAHCAPSLLGDRYDVIVRSLSACPLWGYEIANGRRLVTRHRPAPRTN